MIFEAESDKQVETMKYVEAEEKACFGATYDSAPKFNRLLGEAPALAPVIVVAPEKKELRHTKTEEGIK
jgi:hypothetical protein